MLPVPSASAAAAITRFVVALVCCAACARPSAAQDPDALARSGLAAIEAGRFGDALEASDKASALRPDDASVCFGAGVAAFMLGKDDVARARFERALVIRPDHVAATWLGDLHYRAGRLREAIAIYAAAVERSPGSRDLRLKLDDWRQELELQSRFRQLCSDHFTALFEAEADEPVARAVVERLEAAYQRVGTALGVPPPHPITVVLYTREQFHDITKLAAWSVAAYDGRIRVPLGAIERPDELDRIVSHELAHAVIASLGGRTVPAWLNEGLATVLEPAGSSDIEVTLARAPARPTLSALHRSFVGFSRGDAEIAYASSARAVRQLIDARGMPAVVALLNDLAHGTPFPDAFRRRMGLRYEEFARRAERRSIPSPR
jgi:tetratricopeptide (TPR) repeat protein